MLDDANQNLTLLVPTNDIFRELKEFYDELLENRNQLERFVRLHVLDGETRIWDGRVHLSIRKSLK